MLPSTRLPRAAAELSPSLDPPSPVPALDNQPPWLTALKGAGVAFSCILLFRLAWRLAAVTVIDGCTGRWRSRSSSAMPARISCRASVHWFCDTFFSPQTPLVGPVIFRFRDHHDHPQRIVQLRFLEQDINNFFLMVPALAWLWWSDLPAAGHPWAPLRFSFLLRSLLRHLCHQHACTSGRTIPRAPAAARWLQRRGLILSPERHWVHHQDHSRGFCVISGWMNRCSTRSVSSLVWSGIRALLPAPVTGSDARWATHDGPDAGRARSACRWGRSAL